ncbi:MAG: 4Fe-4S binding protein [Campylobacteraceae bacterium]|nr:4Fe-4S binding protein [Campylobacteraceae bacterium]
MLIYLGTNGVLLFHPGKCTKCGNCITACSAGALSFVENDLCVTLYACIGCFDCVEVCNEDALRQQGG